MLPGWRMCLFGVAWVWRINLHYALNRGVVRKASGRFWPQSHRRNNEFDSHVQPFTSTRETSWRLYLFKAGLSQGGACKNSSPDQLRERERWRSEGGRCCRELKVFWGWSCQCSLTLSAWWSRSWWYEYCILGHFDALPMHIYCLCMLIFCMYRIPGWPLIFTKMCSILYNRAHCVGYCIPQCNVLGLSIFYVIL